MAPLPKNLPLDAGQAVQRSFDDESPIYGVIDLSIHAGHCVPHENLVVGGCAFI
jgi:hypothetical protein